MHRVTGPVRALVSDLAAAIGIDGAALILTVAFLAYGVSLFDTRIVPFVLAGGFAVVFYALARPQRPAPPRP